MTFIDQCCVATDTDTKLLISDPYELVKSRLSFSDPLVLPLQSLLGFSGNLSVHLQPRFLSSLGVIPSLETFVTAESNHWTDDCFFTISLLPTIATPSLLQ